MTDLQGLRARLLLPGATFTRSEVEALLAAERDPEILPTLRVSRDVLADALIVVEVPLLNWMPDTARNLRNVLEQLRGLTHRLGIR